MGRTAEWLKGERQNGEEAFHIFPSTSSGITIKSMKVVSRKCRKGCKN